MSEKSYVCSWTRRIRECLKEYVCTCTCIQFKSFSLLLWVYKWPWCVTISYCLGCSFQRYPEMFRFLLMEGLLSIYIFLWSGNILEWYHAIIAREDNSALLRILAALSRKRTFLFWFYYQLFWLIVLIIFFSDYIPSRFFKMHDKCLWWSIVCVYYYIMFVYICV